MVRTVVKVFPSLLALFFVLFCLFSFHLVVFPVFCLTSSRTSPQILQQRSDAAVVLAAVKASKQQVSVAVSKGISSYKTSLGRFLRDLVDQIPHYNSVADLSTPFINHFSVKNQEGQGGQYLPLLYYTVLHSSVSSLYCAVSQLTYFTCFN